jgi:glycosyltransferase involved in cell wall biosynthesis
MMVSAEGIRLWLLHGIGYSRNIGLSRLVNHIQLVREFSRLAEIEQPPDLIFCCWPVIELSFAAVGYAERHSIPILLDVRDLWPDIFLDAVPSALRSLAKLALAPYYRMTRSAFRRASGIVGISDGYLDWGLAKAGRGRNPNDALFPLGYQEPDWTKASKAEDNKSLRALGVDESRIICWFLGSFGDTYDLEPVIHAARQLETRGLMGPQFVLSGEGHGRERYERLAAGLHNLVFTGWLDADQIASMMRIARVGIAAYRKGAPQGLPNKLFEYMAAGLPILSSLDGECKRFLDDNACGLSYPAGSTDGFLAAMTALTENQKLADELGANALRTYRKHYSASTIYPQLVEHMERVVAQRAETASSLVANT